MGVTLAAEVVPGKQIICRYILCHRLGNWICESAGPRPPSQCGGGSADEDRRARIRRDRRVLRGASRESGARRLVRRAWRAPGGDATTRSHRATPGRGVHHPRHSGRRHRQRRARDLVLFCVKAYDTEPAAQALKPLMATDTAVVTLQNGVDNVAAIAGVAGTRAVLAGAVYVALQLAGPGVVVRTGGEGKIVFGEPGGTLTDRVQRIASAFQASEIGRAHV